MELSIVRRPFRYPLVLGAWLLVLAASIIVLFPGQWPALVGTQSNSAITLSEPKSWSASSGGLWAELTLDKIEVFVGDPLTMSIRLTDTAKNLELLNAGFGGENNPSEGNEFVSTFFEMEHGFDYERGGCDGPDTPSIPWDFGKSATFAYERPGTYRPYIRVTTYTLNCQPPEHVEVLGEVRVLARP